MQIYKLFFNTPIFIFGLLFFTLTSCYDNQGDEEKMSILKQKPVFKIRLSAYGTRYSVRLNDVTIYSEENSASQLDTEFFVNHYVHLDENVLSVEILPSSPGEEVNKHSRVKVELFVLGENDDIKKEFLITDISFIADKDLLKKTKSNSLAGGRFDSEKSFAVSEVGDVVVGEITESPVEVFEGAVILSRRIKAQNSLPLWRFFESDILPDYEILSDEEYYQELGVAFQYLERVHDALAVGTVESIDSIMDLFEERSNETDLAFYLARGETQQGMREALIEAVESDNQKLLGLSKDSVALLSEQNRRLAFMTREKNASAIVFNYQSFQGSREFPIMFRRENGKWIITR